MSYLDALINTLIRVSGVDLPKRPTVNFVDGVQSSDDTVNQITTLNFLRPAWVSVNADNSPFTASRMSPYLALIFPGTGTLSVILWPGQDGDTVVLSDIIGIASNTDNLILTAADGELIEASGGGGFGNEQGFAAAGMTVRLKFRVSDRSWLLW